MQVAIQKPGGTWHDRCMSYQSRAHWCCPAALQTAMQIHGVRMGQARFAKLLGTCAEGTDEFDIRQALDRMGCQWCELETNNRGEAREWLLKFSPVAPILLCVDSWEHWVTVAGCCGPKLWLLDSSNEAWNRAGLGRWALSPKTILKRWRAARRLRADGGIYYGIAVLSCNAAQARSCTGAASDD